MLLSDLLYKFMPQNVKDDIKKDSLQWKIITISFVALNVFIFLQLTRIIFRSSLIWMVLSIILTMLIIYFLERFT